MRLHVVGHSGPAERPQRFYRGYPANEQIQISLGSGIGHPTRRNNGYVFMIVLGTGRLSQVLPGPVCSLMPQIARLLENK